jgi:hypothetical protein
VQLACRPHDYLVIQPGSFARGQVVMAFQLARVGDPAGVGRGIFLYDFTKARK